MKLFTLKTAGLSAAFILSGAISASAVSVSLIDSSDQGPGNTANLSAPNFNGTTPDGASWSGDEPRVTPPPGNVNNTYQSPFSDTPLEDTQSYFAIGGQSGDQGGPSPLTLTFDSPQDQLDMLWGSIDSYNTLTFLGTDGTTSFTGGDIISMFSELEGDPDALGNFEQVALLSFAAEDGESFSSVLFESDLEAFEVGFEAQVIPLPAAVWMLLTAMGGLAFVSRRRKSA